MQKHEKMVVAADDAADSTTAMPLPPFAASLPEVEERKKCGNDGNSNNSY